MESAADFIARHAVAVLACVTLVALGATALVWYFIQAHARSLWAATVGGWNALRATAVAERIRRRTGLGGSLARTAAAAQYLGAYAIVSFVVALAALAAFFELADEIGIDEDLARFDSALSHSLSVHLPGRVLQTVAVITHLGDATFLIPLCAVVVVVLLIGRRMLLAGAWLTATSSGALLNLVLKSLFERTRPVHDETLVSVSGWSFPSGHASGSMLVYGLLGYLIIRHTPRVWHLPAALAGVTLIVFVGFSRVLLQVHYLSDVLAGYACGAAWCALCIAGLEAARWRAGLQQP